MSVAARKPVLAPRIAGGVRGPIRWIVPRSAPDRPPVVSQPTPPLVGVFLAELAGPHASYRQNEIATILARLR